ncbi:hypothetical protein HYW54_03875 [Candidatus Gottesmanbacteria bacterium]|nr:hypothetical protein [Candidatus Gottesmanbacteria bacterium]
MKKLTEEKILNLLLSGKHPKAKKYAGHHVLVIDDKIFPLKEGKEAAQDIKELKKRYGRSPIITFVPRQDITYILFHAKNSRIPLHLYWEYKSW